MSKGVVSSIMDFIMLVLKWTRRTQPWNLRDASSAELCLPKLCHVSPQKTVCVVRGPITHTVVLFDPSLTFFLLLVTSTLVDSVEISSTYDSHL